MKFRTLAALLALFLLAFLVYEAVTYGWVATAILIAFAILPDVALIGAFDANRPGMLKPSHVRFYNLLHRVWIGLAIFFAGTLLPIPAVWGIDGGKVVFFAGLAWLTHIAADRAFGYGLRRPDGSIRPVGGPRFSRAAHA